MFRFGKEYTHNRRWSSCMSMLSSWKFESPCRKEIFFNAQLSFLIYWLSYHRNYSLGFERLKELATADYRQNEQILSVPKIGGFLSAPGPKHPSDVQFLLKTLTSGFDEDAYIVHWDDVLNSILIFEPHRRRVTMILRGSASIRDLVVNATVIPWSASPSDGIKLGKVHLGFWNRVKSSRSTVDRISSLDPVDVRITGHSMGAALGVLVASHLPFTGCKANVSVVTFGGPRIGNEAFCNGFNQLPSVRHWRVSNGWDPVTRIPPHAPAPIDYRHTGHHLWLSHDIVSRDASYQSLTTTVHQATPGTVGVLEASPELYKPSLDLFKGAIEGGVYGVKGHHQMGGRNGYISALSKAKWI